jgi:hypothetical protein
VLNAMIAVGPVGNVRDAVGALKHSIIERIHSGEAGPAFEG